MNDKIAPVYAEHWALKGRTKKPRTNPEASGLVLDIWFLRSQNFMEYDES